MRWKYEDKIKIYSVRGKRGESTYRSDILGPCT